MSARRTSPLFALMRGKGDKEVCGGATNKPQHIGEITAHVNRHEEKNERMTERAESDRKNKTLSFFFFKQYTFIHQIQMFDITEFLPFALL